MLYTDRGKVMSYMKHDQPFLGWKCRIRALIMITAYFKIFIFPPFPPSPTTTLYSGGALGSIIH
jgi:hypothetical protein